MNTALQCIFDRCNQRSQFFNDRQNSAVGCFVWCFGQRPQGHIEACATAGVLRFGFEQHRSDATGILVAEAHTVVSCPLTLIIEQLCGVVQAAFDATQCDVCFTLRCAYSFVDAHLAPHPDEEYTHQDQYDDSDGDHNDLLEQQRGTCAGECI